MCSNSLSSNGRKTCLSAIMMNQGDLLPEKTLVTKTKSRIIRQNELALPKKSNNMNEKLTKQARKTIAKAM